MFGFSGSIAQSRSLCSNKRKTNDFIWFLSVYQLLINTTWSQKLLSSQNIKNFIKMCSVQRSKKIPLCGVFQTSSKPRTYSTVSFVLLPDISYSPLIPEISSQKWCIVPDWYSNLSFAFVREILNLINAVLPQIVWFVIPFSEKHYIQAEMPLDSSSKEDNILRDGRALRGWPVIPGGCGWGFGIEGGWKRKVGRWMKFWEGVDGV